MPGLVRLGLRTDGRALVPAAAPEVRRDLEIRERFDLRDPIAVVVRSDHPDGVFNPATLRRVSELTAALSSLEGVRPADVMSLATEQGFRHQPGTLTFRTLLDPLPETPRELDELRDDLRRIELYEGTLVSRDGRGVAIFVGTPPERDRRALIREIRRIVAARAPPGSPGGGQMEDSPGERVEVLGAPVAESLLGSHILADLGVPPALLGDDVAIGGMVPIAVVVMGLVFLIAFRRPAAALLPLTEIGVCLVIVFGWMGWLGVPVYLTTSVLPVILTAVGAADEIHIFRRYLDLGPDPAAGDAEHRRLVGAALDEMAPPVVKTSVTTAVAFLSFTLSPLPPVRAFGLFTALGVVLCMVYSLTVIPALLVLLGPRRWVRSRKAKGSRAERAGFFPRLGRFAFRRRRLVLAVAALALLLTADGIRRVTVQDSWIDGFASTSSFARATRWFDQQFLGSHLLQLAVEIEPLRLRGELAAEALDTHELRFARPPVAESERLVGSWIRVFQLAEKPGGRPPREWTTWIESVRPEDGGLVVTMPRQRGSVKFWLRPQPGEKVGYEIWSEPFAVPATLRRIAELETFLAEQPGVGGVLGPASYLATVSFMVRPSSAESRRLPEEPDRAKILWSNYTRVRGAERLRRLLDPEYREGLVTVFLEDADYVGSRRLMDAVRGYERDHLAAHWIRVGLAGDVAVSSALIDAVVTTQVRSLILSLVGILVVAALLSRALGWGLLCVVPPAFAVVLNFAAMGWSGIPLGVATSMFAGMTLGVGVDFAIHLLARYERAAKSGLEPEPAIAAAMAITGPAILIDACAVGLGFGVLVLSQVPANARLGVLLMASVLGCFVAACFFVPALVAGSRLPSPSITSPAASGEASPYA
ncbi:MAG: MMPL family transporter [bacterium]|nr:MMPL family transporter [bacterium]